MQWGANLVEWEPMRYRPRRELLRTLGRYDVVQVVAGSPAWGFATTGLIRPVVLQAATRASWEREAMIARLPAAARAVRKATTNRVSSLEMRAVRSASAVLVENPEMAAFVRAAGQSNVRIAPPGVDTDFFRPHPAGVHADGPIVCVARFGDPRKGLNRVVAAYRELVVSCPAVPPLVIAGLGTPPGDLVQQVNSSGLTDLVHFRMDIEQGALLALLQSASVLVLASYEEGLGLTIIEGMACGLPVVATDTAGSRVSVVEGTTGFLVAQGTDERVAGELADRVLRVLTGDIQAMGRAASERAAAEFSKGVLLQRFLDSYADVLGSGQTRSRPTDGV